MKLELLVPRATLRGAEMPGDVIDAPRDEAERLIAAGHARPVRRRKAERAVPPDTTEKAVR
jgi:hypothetical protein